MRTYRTTPGLPDPLGATPIAGGTNFAIYSEGATGVELCLFDADGAETRIRLRHRTEFVWHVHVAAVGAGQRYGYRVEGPWEPERGLRFNPNVVLIDPYARAVDGKERWERGAFSYDIYHSEKDLVRVETDQRAAPLGVVIDSSFDWKGDTPPNVPLRRSVIYEAHVKGLSMRHPDVPPEIRGTYSAIASEPILRHLHELGVTAVELLPVHSFVDDQFLLERGLRNYWGYNSIAFFAPDVRYRAGDELASEVRQFKRMVRALHAAGIEVILDVVYNHTAEGNHLGPTFSLRGVDNATYYRLVEKSPRYYFDYTGTGNSLNVRHPQTLRLITDSLRYWVEEMHVDGFRFDLASTLARGLYEVDKLSSFFTVVHQDPVISRVKLIAEPWDLGNGGYQVGRFPVRWAEWNGKYRDAMRAFWRGDGNRAAELGYRLTGSSDLYQRGGRSPAASVNFITAHDGFTLRDLVSYDQKHNEANGENNADGADDASSWNSGHEGETDDPGVRALRNMRVRDFLATLLLSQGTPMICAGDEMGRTQGGNNNAYCQDNETSWVDWELDDERRALLVFTRNLVRLRREHPLLRRGTFFEGREIRGLGAQDIVWFRHDGAIMTDEDWSGSSTSSLGVFMAGSGLDPAEDDGRHDDLVLVLNASPVDLDFVIPAFVERGRTLAWTALVDTADDATKERVEAGATTKMRARSLKLFARRALGPGGLDSVYRGAVSTYRLQMRRGFDFRAAREVVDYVADLGAAAVHVSPYLKARRGSTHGYDVVDHSALEPALGAVDEYRAFAEAVRARGLSHIADFVPNHVGIDTGENAWWQDVLENGPCSVFADFFDIEWNPPSPTSIGKLLLPVLGRQFGEEIDEGRIAVRRDGGAMRIVYADKSFPASPQSYVDVLERAKKSLELAADDHRLQDLESILDALRHLPSTAEPLVRVVREREVAVVKRRLGALTESSPEVGAAIDAALDSISRSPDALERVLDVQYYRLAYWRVATEEINYRRFFDVNELAAIRMEDPEVFAAAHSLVLDLVREGWVTGLRLDHTDGLYDPEEYFDRLQASLRDALARGGHGSNAPVTLFAEKILCQDEELRAGWSISGTTGYDFLAAANGLFVDAEAERAMTEIYARFADTQTDFAVVVRDSKRAVMDGSFSSELHVLGHALKRIASESRRGRDFTLPALIRIIKETVAAFRVYRTYVRRDGSYQKFDEEHVASAIARARRDNPMMEASAFEFLADVLLLRERQRGAVDFAMRFQQLTGPMMAKGVEDTAVYRFHRLLSLNEVGCDPSKFGVSTSEFHAHNGAILTRWPQSMTTTTTHDTKRSEDVRARLAVLSEMPESWAESVRALESVARAAAAGVGPSANDAYAFHQTVVGALPYEAIGADELSADFVERVVAWFRKALREAKVRTSWVTPNEAYEWAAERFARAALGSRDYARAATDLARSIATYGASNSLAQLALRLASPGVPDIYQGNELWDFSLVDPDNRRPVDFAKRRALLATMRERGAGEAHARDLVEHYEDGRIKMYVTWLGLERRRASPAVFLEGGYRALGDSEHVVAFERTTDSERLVCVAPRLARKLTGGARPWALGDVWGDAELRLERGGRFRDLFTGTLLEGETLRVADVLRVFPVAWLVEEQAGSGTST